MGRDWEFGWRASWAVHGWVHGWCMGSWWWCCVGLGWFIKYMESFLQKVLQKCNMLMYNDDWNTDHGKWVKRIILSRGNHIWKKNNKAGARTKILNFHVLALAFIACSVSNLFNFISGTYWKENKEFFDLFVSKGEIHQSKISGFDKHFLRRLFCNVLLYILTRWKWWRIIFGKQMQQFYK